MSVQSFNPSSQQDRFMSEEQFEEVVEAILAGKYSWACVLILQAAGYNPLHYIPYRTYNRLIKDNRLKKRDSSPEKKVAQSNQSTRQLEDLSYLDRVEQEESKITAGIRLSWLDGITVLNYG